MFTMTVTPRFYETDAFGHVNNTVFLGWFETAREPIFRLFTPDMDIRRMNLILARTEVDYLRPGLAKALQADCSVTKHGQQVANVQVSVWQESPEKPVAVARAHFLLD